MALATTATSSSAPGNGSGDCGDAVCAGVYDSVVCSVDCGVGELVGADTLTTRSAWIEPSASLMKIVPSERRLASSGSAGACR